MHLGILLPVYSVHRGQRRGVDTPEMEVQIGVSSHMGVGKGTWVLWKSIERS